jgi:hypothetical protein
MLMSPRSAIVLVMAVVVSTAVLAQQYPIAAGGCGVSASGLQSCNWISSIGPSPAQRHDLDLVVTTVSLAAGAPLTRLVGGYDNLIVALTDAHLQNEAKAAEQSFEVSAQQIFLMPRNQSFALRNVGDKEVKLLLIELRTASPEKSKDTCP